MKEIKRFFAVVLAVAVFVSSFWCQILSVSAFSALDFGHALINLPDLIRFGCGVIMNDELSLLAVENFETYLADVNASSGKSYQSFSHWAEENITVTDHGASITPEGRNELNKFTSDFVSENLTYGQILSLPIVSPLDTPFRGDEYTKFCNFIETYQEDYYIFLNFYGSKQVESQSSFFNKYSIFYLKPKNNNNFFVLNESHVNNSVYEFYSAESSKTLLFGKNLVAYNSSLELDRGYKKILCAQVLNDDFVFENVNQSELYFGFFTSESGFDYFSPPKLYNNGTYPAMTAYGSSLKPMYLLISFGKKFVMPYFKSVYDYDASVRSAYFTPTYYETINTTYSNDSVLVDNSIYNSTPTYTEINNFYNTYQSQEGVSPDDTVVYNYITNYYNDHTTNDTSSTSSGNGFLGAIGDLIGSFVTGLGSILVTPIKLLANVVTELFAAINGVVSGITSMPSTVGALFTTFLDWLPPEWVSLITLSLSLSVLIAVVKFLRG